MSMEMVTGMPAKWDLTQIMMAADNWTVDSDGDGTGDVCQEDTASSSTTTTPSFAPLSSSSSSSSSSIELIQMG